MCPAIDSIQFAQFVDRLQSVLRGLRTAKNLDYAEPVLFQNRLRVDIITSTLCLFWAFWCSSHLMSVALARDFVIKREDLDKTKPGEST